MLTILSLPFPTAELTAKVTTVQADRLSMVFTTARWRSFPIAGPALKLAQ